MLWDFGPYGKGISGYIQYMKAYERIEKEGRRGRKPSSGGGCLTSVLLILVFAALVIAVLF